MPEFWRSSGFHLLARNAAGQLAVTDDFLRAYLMRPEIHPVEESCTAERALHAALMAEPRRAVSAAGLEAIADVDARDNYRLMLRFRDRLIAAGTLEACYAELFRAGAIDVPPLFIDQLVHAILRNILDGCEDALRLRAAELFFREQKATLRDGQLLLSSTSCRADDAETSRTKLPWPWRTSISSRNSSRLRASRTEPRFTPRASASSRSLGRRAPGA